MASDRTLQLNERVRFLHWITEAAGSLSTKFYFIKSINLLRVKLPAGRGMYKTTEFQERKKEHIRLEFIQKDLKCDLPVGQFLVSSENQKQVQGSLFFPHCLQVHPPSPETEKTKHQFILGSAFTFTSRVKEMIS